MMRWRNHHLSKSLLYQQILVFHLVLFVTGLALTQVPRKDLLAVVVTTNPATPEPKHDEGKVRVHLEKEMGENETLTVGDSTEPYQSDVGNRSLAPSPGKASGEGRSLTSANVSTTVTTLNDSSESNKESKIVVESSKNTSHEASTSSPTSSVFVTTESYSRTVRISLKSFSNVSNPTKNVTNTSIAENRDEPLDSGLGTGSNRPVLHPNGDYKELLTDPEAVPHWENVKRNSSSSAARADKVPNDIEPFDGKSSLFPSSNVTADNDHRVHKQTLPDYPDIVTNRTKMKGSAAAAVDNDPTTNGSSSVVTEQVQPNLTVDGSGSTSHTIKSLTSTNSAFSASNTGRPSGGEAIASEMYATSNPTVENVHTQDDPLGVGAIVGIIFGVLGVVAFVGGVFGYLIYYRRFRPLSEIKYPTDNCAYVDDTLRVSYVNNHIELPKENSEEMFSLDNDSFLNSLEAMTLQNYWAEDAKNTKV